VLGIVGVSLVAEVGLLFGMGFMQVGLVLRNWCLVGILGHVGHFLFQHLFVQ